MNIKTTLNQIISDAMSKSGVADADAIVKQSQRIEFGHYQANGIMGAAKKARTNPRELAAQVVTHLPAGQFQAEIAGPGFINLTLNNEWVAQQLKTVYASDRLDIDQEPGRHILIDYSAPNLAKEMHIGHLRPTTIGDTAARVLEFLGHKVTRANHVGDWGAQFGSLLAYMDDLRAEGQNELSSELKDLEAFYRSASALFKTDEVFAARARSYVVKLQSGDETCLSLWREFIDESIRHCQAVYDQLNITLRPEHIRAESAYNDDLPIVIDELTKASLIEESDGALCVFLDEFKGKDDKPLPAMMRKSDGGYPYMATDVAAVRYRTSSIHVDEALYFVGAQQQLHLRQVFAVAKAGGYLNNQPFRHLPFGWVLKADGTPFKTRDGADVKLKDVLDEAVARAQKLVEEKNPELSAQEKTNIASVVGIGAIKYAELSKNRTTDYIFDWDTMLSFEGNTAPYLQYAYTRIRSIFRRAEVDADNLVGEFYINEPAELALAVKLLQFPEAIKAMTDDYQANIICGYLFELAAQFMSFYEACPILSAEEPTRTSRLLLANLTARTLQQGLDLLGIETVEQM